jgi:acyl-CoA synthetase (AMP-forming)/AMP-acid ligase II
MASALDEQLAAIFAELGQPGAPLETRLCEHHGARVPMFAHAPETLPQLIAHYAAAHGEQTFLVDGDIRLSFAETHAHARAFAAGLGIGKGDHVAIAARNSAMAAVAFLGVILAGGVAVMVNGWWTGIELAAAIARTRCRLVLADEKRAARLRGFDLALRTFAHDAFPAPADTAMTPALAASDPATILFTSGSSAAPRAALSSQRALVQAALGYAAQTLVAKLWLDRHGGGAPAGQPATLLSLPLFHVTGLVTLLLQSLVLGRRLVILPRWDPREAMRLIEAEQLTYFLGVPQMSVEIATHPERQAFDLSSCIHFASGGAARVPAHVALLRQRLPHAHPLVGYGLTESNALGTGAFNANHLAKPASAGTRALPLIELAILDAAGNALPAGESGEIAIRSVTNFDSYWNDAETTARAFTAEAYLRTGDLGRLDDDGYLFVEGRLKDIVIRSGENISCAEVEAALLACPGVAEAAVFALPDPHYGEVPAAVWRALPGEAPAEARLRAFLAARLAPFKLPARLWQSAAPLPTLASGKLDKAALTARYAAESEAAISRE